MSADSSPVLVDTSVWVELLRHPNSALRPEVDALIGEGRVRVCGAIMAELMQGATTAKDAAAVEGLAQSIANLKADDLIWKDAGKLSRSLRLKGVIVGLLDCYLSALALRHGCRIMSLDKHFPLIAKHTDLRLALPS